MLYRGYTLISYGEIVSICAPTDDPNVVESVDTAENISAAKQEVDSWLEAR